MIGDEYHYMFDCSYIKSKRPHFLGQQYFQVLKEKRMSSLFETKDIDQLNMLALFAPKIIDTCESFT